MEDNQNTIAFIQWLAKSLDQDPETIMQSVEEAMKTEEGQQQIMQLYQKFEQQEQQNQMFKKGGKIDAFVIKYAQSGIKVPIRSNPTFARWSAEWNAKKDPAEGIEDRRTGYVMDSKGGQYYFEDGVKDGYSFKTYMTVPQPGDTIVTQKVASDKGWLDNDYPMGSYEYKSVMSRNRGNKGWTIMDAIRKVMDKK